ncbi:hypothetical protein [Iodobacter fluviatilis]|uniref:hypothetical protein n=1 Tax=Iodobacter fluviatilis TaxID=537 RepID=UPI00165E594D|nr:hypothetical protein [Iodobacter fluviatilis]
MAAEYAEMLRASDAYISVLFNVRNLALQCGVENTPYPLQHLVLKNNFNILDKQDTLI